MAAEIKGREQLTQVSAAAAVMSVKPFDRRRPPYIRHARRRRYVTVLSAFFSMTAPSSGPGPDQIGQVIFKVTGPVGPFFGWTIRSPVH